MEKNTTMEFDIEFEDSKEQKPPLKFLIVEDDATDTMLLSVRIKILYPGCNIVSAGCIADAYAALKEYNFSLIFLDLNLPDGYGPLTVEEVRRYNRKTPIIVITGMGSSITVDQALKLGANNVVLKSSISSEDFKIVIDQNLIG